MQRGSRFSSVWDLFQLNRSRFNHHKGGWTLKKKINIIVGDGALMGSIVLRNAGLRSLEEAEARYLESLRKACPDLADKVHHV
jgi:hypothetical protein